MHISLKAVSTLLQVGNACIDLSKAYLAAKQGEQAGKHLHRAIGILNQSGRGNNLSKVCPTPKRCSFNLYLLRALVHNKY